MPDIIAGRLRAVSKSLVDAYFSQDRRTQVKWLRSLSGLFQETRTPEVSSTAPRLNHRSLVGREEIIASLLTQFVNESPFLLLHGPAGAGKTSLALEVANRLRMSGGHPLEAVIWLPARPAIFTKDGFMQSPITCGSLQSFVTNICAGLGRTDILRELTENQPALLQAALVGRRVLLIPDDLDEVADERVVPFLTTLPQSVAVLATSRKQLAVFRQVRVDPLGHIESEALLRDLLSQGVRQSEGAQTLDEGEMNALYRITGGIPLALVWSSALLDIGYGVDQVVHQFEDSNNDILRFCFSNTWRTVRPNLAGELLAALALFPMGATGELLSATVSRDPKLPSFLESLAQVKKLGLVDTRNSRYSLLPMTRSYIMNDFFGVPPDSRSGELRIRWADALARYVSDSAHEPNSEDWFAKLEEERSNIEALLVWASEREDHDLVKVRAAVIYFDASYYFFSQGFWQILLDNSSWAVHSLWRQGLFEEAVDVLLTWVARVHLLRGDHAELEKCFNRAEGLISTLPDENPVVQAIFDFNAASRAEREGGGSRDVELLRNASIVFDRAGRQQWRARTANRLGNVLAVMGRYEESKAAFEESMKAGLPFEATAWGREMVAVARGNRGILANREGNHAQAIMYLSEVAPFITQSMDAATLLMELAIAEYHLGHEHEAFKIGSAAQAKARHLNVGVSISESDPEWEKATLPRLDMKYGKR